MSSSYFRFALPLGGKERTHGKAAKIRVSGTTRPSAISSPGAKAPPLPQKRERGKTLRLSLFHAVGEGKTGIHAIALACPIPDS
jgi:hypothetical protein